MDVIQERLEREYNLKLVTTAPSVVYKVHKTNGEVISIDNPAALPPTTEIKFIEEPMVKATVIVPSDYIGAVMELCRDKRGTYKSMDYIDKTRVMIVYEMPLNEIIYDFFDKLKSMTRGYASLDYELSDYKESDLAKLATFAAVSKTCATFVLATQSRLPKNLRRRWRAIVRRCPWFSADFIRPTALITTT